MGRFIIGWVAICLWCASQQTVFSQNPYAPGCLDDVSLGQNWADSIPPGEDGYTHLTFTYVDANRNRVEPDPSISYRVSLAISEWNSFKDATHIKIDTLPPGEAGTAADLQIQYVEDGSDVSAQIGGCAGYNTETGTLHYGSLFMQAAQGDPSIGQTIIAHEIGHVFGLEDEGQPSYLTIMNNPSNDFPDACTHPVMQTTHVLSSDANLVTTCVNEGHRYQNWILLRANERMMVDNSNPSYDSFTPYRYEVAFSTCEYTYTTLYYTDSDNNVIESDPFLTATSCY